MTNSLPTLRRASTYGWGAFAGLISAALAALTFGHAASLVELFDDVAATPFFMFAAIPFFMAGFSRGFVACAVAGLVAIVASLFTMPSGYVFFFLLADIVPALLIVFLALRLPAIPAADAKPAPIARAEGAILTALVAYACVLFLGVYGATLSHEGGLIAITQDALNDMSDQAMRALTQMGETPTPDMALNMRRTIDLLIRFAPAFVMCSWLFLTIAAVAIAQGLLKRKKRSMRSPFALADLHVPSGVIFAVAMTGVAAIAAPAPYDYLGLNLALVLGLPFFFAGLAVIHAWAARTRAPTLLLTAFYIVVSFLVYLVLLVAMLGAVDQWIDFRKRFAERKVTK